MYGNANEKPHLLESSTPSPNFEQFCRFVLRSMAASVDMPYEVIAKDFSQTNYSSARAAMLEAWKVFTLYRQWLVGHYCQPIYQMVIEEAWLRGTLKLPAGAPDFYEAPRLYASALWIGPPRGYVDPVKEVAAMDRAELASKHPELLAQIEAEAKKQGADEAKTAAEQQQQQAVQAALDNRMALFAAVAGAEAAQRVETLAAAGITSGQLQALGALLPSPAPASGQAAGTPAQQAILAHLTAQTPGPLDTRAGLKGGGMSATIDRIASL